jgi:hypothetical protein
MATPNIIAGPILRRVDKKKVSVWIAFSKNYHCTLKIFEGDNVKLSAGAEGTSTTDANPIPTDKAETPTVQFGRHLWIALITAEVSTPGLQADKIYSYNVVFESMDTPTDKGDLRTDGLLSDDAHEERPQKALGYKNDVLPSFTLPADDPAKLFIAQASCRKMHGDGEDALAYLDKVIEDNLIKPDKRPQQLFLTGDQIYADDVAGALLRYCGNQDGASLVGDETIQIRQDSDAAIQELSAEHVTFPPYMRQHVMNTYAGLTSGSASSHLLSFEEFCGVYLHYWSIRSWPLDFYKRIDKIIKDNKKSVIRTVANSLLTGTEVTDDPNLVQLIRAAKTREASNFVFNSSLNEIFDENPPGEKFNKWLSKVRSSMEHELKNIADFAKVLPKVSRILANVPCYMIFDDHEITDDWYLTQRWKNQVFSKPMGRDIIRNGLMAYAVFQDWGNVPDEYVPIPQTGEDVSKLTPRTKFIRLVQEYGFRAANGQNLNTLRAQVIEPMETLLGMGNEASQVKWHYNVPTGPTHTYVLNTRTSREYPSLNASPGLILEDELKKQLPENLPEATAPFVFVISPVPVLGLASFEELIQPVAASIVGLSATTGPNPGVLAGEISFDFEAWGFNIPAFEALLEQLSKYSKVIILSGDVHYSATLVLDYWKGNTATPTARILQLTSSSSKNIWMENLAFFKSALIQRIFTGIGDNLEKLGWKDKVLSPSGNVSIRNRHRLRQNPAVIPTAGWQPGATVGQEPDYRWRLKFAADDNPRTDDIIQSDINLADAGIVKEGYKKVVQRHLNTFISGVSRRLVWPSNISTVTFEADGASWKVKHGFLFEKGDRDPAKKQVDAHIKHSISLTAAGAETTRPELV